MSTVAILDTGQPYYSPDWAHSDDFAEKRALIAMGELLGAHGNPFSSVVYPGDSVFVKPNWVTDTHPAALDLFALITHSSVIKATVTLLAEAMNFRGRIVVGDAPQWDCDFANLLSRVGADSIFANLRNNTALETAVLDLRQVAVRRDGTFVRSRDRCRLQGDPRGYVVVDLGDNSAFEGMSHVDRLYGADYDRSEIREHHHAGRHEYLISRSVLEADLVVSIPKLKVHKKVGVTLNSKGMVGINGNKNWVAHFRVGSPKEGGDEYPDTDQPLAANKARAHRFLIDALLARRSFVGDAAYSAIRTLYGLLKPLAGSFASARPACDAGNWHGNDTAWRMAADLARVVEFGGVDGRLHSDSQRRVFSILDGIVGGDRLGPLAARPRPCGVLVAGHNLLSVDIAGTRLMGFDWQRVPHLAWLVDNCGKDTQVPLIRSNRSDWATLFESTHDPALAFEPHPGWAGAIEVARPVTETAGP